MEQIGRYQILNEVGRGAMGVVYRAQDPAIGRIIAVKTIRLTDLSDVEERQRLRERLFREAQSAGILSHPNIVTIYDIAEEGGNACIFMEYVNGPTLERVLAEHPPDKQTFLHAFRQTAAALDYAHRKGIVHRDIKPANIMIHEDGQAKITDFGVAKVISHQMTQSGGMMGTPNYMSPEQVQGLAVDGRADQFGLAVIAYELLTGEKPFAGDYLPTLLYKIVREDPQPVHRLNPTLGGLIDAVLRQGLAKNPAERFESCSDFVRALSDACHATPGWIPVPRGASQSMATVAGTAPVLPRTRLTESPLAEAAQPVPPPRSLSGEAREASSERNPLLRSMVWVLVGIGAIGLALLGAQHFLVSSPEPVAATHPVARSAPERSVVSEPQSSPPVSATIEKPSPAGDLQLTPAPPAEPRSQEPASVAPPAQKNQGDRSIQLITDPPGAKVTIDENPALSCNTPCLLAVPAGRHTLTTELVNYRPYPRVINVPENSDVFLKLSKASGTLSITSSPAGASIQINGEARPQTTPATFSLGPGSYRVRVTKDGVPLDFEVQIKDGEFQNRNVNFQ